MNSPEIISTMETANPKEPPGDGDSSEKQACEQAQSSKSIIKLFEELESALIRYAYGIVHRREVAEEIVQDGFLKLHKHWDSVENPQAWIYRSVRNLALNHLRKSNREVDTDKVVDISEGAPENSLERMEALGNMRMLMTELPEKEKELVKLKYIDECSYTEIAEKVGISVGNVGYKLHHILKGLGEKLKKLGVESSKG